MLRVWKEAAMTRRRDMMLLDIIECNHVPMIPVVEDNVILHWLCGCGREIPAVKKTIYWFKDQGLFSGHARDIGCADDTEVEHKCDAMIKDNEVVKNRYGGHCRVTDQAISDLHAIPLSAQFAFFKSIDMQKPESD